MIYNVTNDFTKINETSGTIQNTSRVFDLEVSNSPEPNSGFLLFGLNKFSFHNETIYLRCIGGVADVRVVPFSTSGGGNAASNIDDFNSQLDSPTMTICNPPLTIFLMAVLPPPTLILILP